MDLFCGDETEVMSEWSECEFTGRARLSELPL
jgi:hypothetical protein